ncbi:MAG: hypothetical protein E7323_00645 [Clostridiales bacterium]|nr:hypothetical protein [Clostridiales bacterium]
MSPMKPLMLCLLMLTLLLMPVCGLATAETAAIEPAIETRVFKDMDIPAFLLTSEDLHDGAWDPVIAKTSDGSLSPQLSWEHVPGAACYVIYMVDTNVMDFVHWMSNNVTETMLPQGWAVKEEYVGPYPPPFETHNYDVYVLALREPVEAIKGTFNAANVFFAKNVLYLDTPAEGITGNLLGYGYLSGTYTGKE